MANDNIIDIYFKVGVDNKPLEQGFKDTSKKASAFGDTLKAILASKVIEKGINTIVSGFQKIGSVIEKNMGSAVSRLDTLNSYAKTMEALGYSTDQSKNSISSLSKAIDGLPTTLDGIVSWQQQFTALSGDIEKSTGLTIALNNATLAAGKGQEVANNAMGNWYAILASGVPDAQHWQSIYSTMPAQMNQIAEATLGVGKKSDDLYKAWKDGEVTAEDVTNALIKLNSEGLNGVASFSDQAQVGAQTIQTAYGNISTAIGKNIAKVLDVLNGDTSEGGGRIVQLLLTVKGIINSIGDTVSKFVSDHAPEITKIMDAINSIFKGEDIAGNFKSMFEGIGTIISDVFGKIKTFFEDHKDEVIQTFQSVFGSLIQVLVDMLPVLVPIAVSLLGTFVKTILDNVPLIINGAVQLIQALVSGIEGSLPLLIPSIVDAVVLILNTVVDNLDYVIDAALKIIVALANGLVDALPKLAKAIPEITGKIVAVLLLNLPDIVVAAIEIIIAITKGLIQALPYIIESVAIIITTFIDEFKKGAEKGNSEMVESALQWCMSVIGAFMDAFTGFKDKIVEAVSSWIEGIGNKISESWQDLVTKVTEFFQPAVDVITSIWNGFMDIFGPLIDAFKELFETIFIAIQVIASRVWENIKSTIITVVENVKEFLRPAFEAIRKYVVEPLQKAWSVVTDVWGKIKEKISTVATDVMLKVKDVFEKIRSAIAEKLTAVLSKVKEIWDGIKSKITEVVNNAKQWGKDLVDNFVKGLKDKANAMADGVKNLAKTIRNNIGFSEPKEGPLSNFHTYAPDMIDLFTEGLYKSQHKLKDAFADVFEMPSMENIKVASNSVSGKIGSGNTIHATFNITASEGQDVREIAKVVIEEMQNLIDDKEKVYA